MRERRGGGSTEAHSLLCWPNTENDWKALKNQKINTQVICSYILLYSTAYYSRTKMWKKNNIFTEDDDGSLQEKPGN